MMRCEIEPPLSAWRVGVLWLCWLLQGAIVALLIIALASCVVVRIEPPRVTPPTLDATPEPQPLDPCASLTINSTSGGVAWNCMTTLPLGAVGDVINVTPVAGGSPP